MSEEYVLGVDNGGTLTKAAIYNLSGQVQALAQTKLAVSTPRPLFTERDMDDYWQANITSIKDCLAKSNISPEKIKAVAVTGHGNGLYLAKADGTGARPGIISTDLRAQSYVDDWLQRPDYESRVRSRTGSTVWAGQPVALLAWLNDNEPEVFNKTDHVLFAKDYIRFRLTGEAKVEKTDVSGVGFMDILTGELSKDLFDFFSISNWFDKIPPIVDSSEIAGYITEEVTELTGLAPGTPVAGGMMDVAAGAVAAGLADEKELCVITGTWSINEVLTHKPNMAEKVFLTLNYPIDGLWLVLEGSPNGISNLDWFQRNVIRASVEAFAGTKLTDQQFFATCEEMISQITPQLSDPIYLPYINGTSVFPDGRAGFEGITAFHDIRHLVRAVYEGVIFSHLYNIKTLHSYGEITGHIRFTGGAANSKLWLQMFADGFNTALDVVNATESGTLGSAIASAVCAGCYPDMETAIRAMTSPPRQTVFPNAESSKIFQERFNRFVQILESKG